MKRVAIWCTALLSAAACAAFAVVELSAAARMVRTEDHNGDGRPDIWRRYDAAGRLTEVDVDSNFDGSPDIQEYYDRGVLIRRESDRNFNGQADLIEEFDGETHGQTRSVVDIDFDGTADLLVLFRDGRPVYSMRASALTRRTNADSHAADSRHATRLVRLADPFEEETAVRAVHSSSLPDEFVGLSTSGGLPSAPFSAISRVSVSTPLAASDVRADDLALLRRRSPRAPPLS